MEKNIARRLNRCLERNDLISEFQSGFRSRRRTTDHILKLHDIVYKTMANRRSVIALFLGLEKVYDMVFKDAVLLKFTKLGINEPILHFIKSLLCNRTFQVRIFNTYSIIKALKNGIPQDSCLSPLLFTVMINDLPKYINGIFALYADDCSFWQVGTDFN